MKIRSLGRQGYAGTWQAMRDFTDARDPQTPDELWQVEHAPVYTVGVAGRREHLPRIDNGIPVVQVDRGGQVTYHGPGQVVVYTLLDIARMGIGVRALVRLLENAVIGQLARHGIRALGRVDAPGVYVDGAKIAALGLRVRRGRCYHGLALNVDMDLSPFSAIDPCGYPGMAVVDLRRLGVTRSPAGVGDELIAIVSEQLRERAPAP